MTTATAVPVAGFNIPPVPQAPAGGGAPQPAPQPTPAPQAPTAPTPPSGGGADLSQLNPANAAELLARALGQAKPPAAPAQPTPAPQAPQAPQVPQPAPERPTGGLNDLKAEDIADPQVRALGELLVLSAPGVDVQRTLGNAIDALDPALIDRAYLSEKFGDKAPQLVKVAEKIVQAVQADTEQTVQGIYSTAGGQAQWDAAVAAFNQNAPEFAKQAAKVMLDSNDRSKILNGAKFVVDFATQGGYIAQAGQPGLVAQGGRVAAAGIDKQTFQAELRQLDPNSQDYLQKRGELFERRKAGKARGL